jgi:hypothetical protein
MYCEGNPVYDLLNCSDYADYSFYDVVMPQVKMIRRNNAKVLSFKHLYYSLKYKETFRELLWEKVRLPKVEKTYSPKNIAALLQSVEEDDSEGFDRVLEEM